VQLQALGENEMLVGGLRLALKSKLMYAFHSPA
jgi:hypothetical protein